MAFLGGLFDPPAANVPTPTMQTYAPQGMGGSDQNLLGGISGLGQFNMYGNYLPAATGFTGNLLNNPGMSGFIQGAGTAGQMGQAGAMNQFGAGGDLYGLGGRIGQTAFDPQNALYDRTVQQLQDQTRAGQAARGIQTTPYGAGLEDQQMRNFNIDWQNQQLQRQIQGGQAIGGLYGQGAQMQGQAPIQYLQASGMPYQANQMVGQNQMGALNALGQFGQGASGIPQQQIADWQNYLGWGNQANQGANSANNQMFQNQLNQANQGFNQQQTTFGNIGRTIGAVAPYAMAMLSDARVKDDIEPVGELYDNTPVYSFRYKGDPTPRIGLIAQDVERRRPDAVVSIRGVKAVDYRKATQLSRDMAAFSKWAA